MYWYDVGSSWLMETQKSLKIQNGTPQPILRLLPKGKKGCYSLNMVHNQSFSDVIQPNNAIRIFRQTTIKFHGLHGSFLPILQKHFHNFKSHQQHSCAKQTRIPFQTMIIIQVWQSLPHFFIPRHIEATKSSIYIILKKKQT